MEDASKITSSQIEAVRRDLVRTVRTPVEIADQIWRESPAVRKAVRLANTDGGHLTLKELQTGLRQFLIGVLTCPEGRESYVGWALKEKNIGEAMKHAIASMPREESRVEEKTLRVVFLAGQQTAEDWLAEHTLQGDEPEWMKDVPPDTIEGAAL